WRPSNAKSPRSWLQTSGFRPNDSIFPFLRGLAAFENPHHPKSQPHHVSEELNISLRKRFLPDIQPDKPQKSIQIQMARIFNIWRRRVGPLFLAFQNWPK